MAEEKKAPDRAEDKPPEDHGLRQMAHEHPRAVTTTAVTMLLLLAVAGAGVGFALWERHKASQARQAEQDATDKQKEAEKEAKKLKDELHASQAGRKAADKERDRAKAAEKAARQAEEDIHAVLAFIKDKLMGAGRPTGESLVEEFWTGGKGKDLTLRKAVDGAEAQIAQAFADRPMAEASVREMLGFAYLNLSAAPQAVKQFERALELRQAWLGVNDRETAESRNKLAVAYRLANRPDDAGRLFKTDTNSPVRATALAVRAALLLTQKKPVEAELKLRECLNIREKVQPDEWPTFDAKSMLGEALLDQKKYADAEPLLLEGYKGLKKYRAKIPPSDKIRFTRAIERLIRLYDAWNKSVKSAQWREELEAAKKG